MNQINWIIAIVEHGHGNHAASLFEKSACSVLAITQGRGTASSAIMDCLGLDQPEKELVIGIGARKAARLLLKRLVGEMEFKKPGKGIAFLIPLSGISKAAAEHLPSVTFNDTISYTDNKEDSSMQAFPDYELIASLIDEDISSLVVDAAKAAGCQGGTLIKARDFNQSSRKFLGISLAKEKEILLILIPKKMRSAVLNSICETVMKETGERASLFAIPIDAAEGITLEP